MRKTIVFDASCFDTSKPTGVPVFVAGLIQHLAESNNNCDFVGIYPRIGNLPDWIPKASNISYYKIPNVIHKIHNQCRRKFFEIPLKLIYPKKVDLILNPAYIGFQSKNIPTINIVHDIAYLKYPESIAPKQLSDFRNIMPKQLAKSSHIITVSETTRSTLIQSLGIEPTKITSIFIPVKSSLNLYNNSEIPDSISKPYFLFVGSIVERKNCAKLIEGFNIFNKKNQYQLVLAGDNSNIPPNVSEHINNNIIFTGFTDVKTQTVLYAKCLSFVSASLDEGFGMPILEAGKLSKPSLLSDIPIFHEVAGDSALFFNQNDPKSIAKTMEIISSDNKLIMKLSKKALLNTDKYQWNLVIDKINPILKSIIKI